MSTHSKQTQTEKEVVKKGPEGAAPVPSERVGAIEMPTESQLVSFGERVTYTFAYGKEVGSIHFDRGRGEIFFKGHNIRNMDLEEWQMQILEEMRRILSGDNNGKRFASAYGHVLDKITLEKKHQPKIS